jgi:hypothetical protein
MKYLTLVVLCLAISSTSFAGWIVQSKKDKMTDKMEVTLELRSTNKFKGKQSSLDIYLECGNIDRLNIMLFHPGFLNVTLPVHVRFDKDERQSIGASIGGEYKSYFLGTSGGQKDLTSNEFYDKLKQSKKLLVSYFDSDAGELISEFNIIGIDSALKKQEKICSKNK